MCRSQAAAKIGVNAKWTQGKFPALFRWRHDIQACDGVVLIPNYFILLTIKIENASKVCIGVRRVKQCHRWLFWLFLHTSREFRDIPTCRQVGTVTRDIAHISSRQIPTVTRDTQ